MSEPNLWLVIGAVVVAVVLLRFVLRFAVRLAVIGLLIVGALWLWDNGTFERLGGIAG